MKDLTWINQLKIRAAMGVSGNNSIKNDQWRYLYGINSTGGPGFGEATQFGEKWYGNLGGNTFANKDIKWETTLTRNLAADITLFDSRLTITPEVYWNTTETCFTSQTFLQQPLRKPDAEHRAGNQQGFELTVSGDLLRGSDYVFSANLTMGLNKKKIDRLNGTDDVIWDQNNRWKSSFKTTV